jgi:hypothetical protein
MLNVRALLGIFNSKPRVKGALKSGAQGAVWDGQILSVYDTDLGALMALGSTRKGKRVADAPGRTYAVVLSELSSHIQMGAPAEGSSLSAREDSLRFQLSDSAIDMDESELEYRAAEGLTAGGGVIHAVSKGAIASLAAAQGPIKKPIASVQAWHEALARGCLSHVDAQGPAPYAALVPCKSRSWLFVFCGGSLQLPWVFEFTHRDVDQAGAEVAQFLHQYETRLAGNSMRRLFAMHGRGEGERAQALCAEVSVSRPDLQARPVPVDCPADLLDFVLACQGTQDIPSAPSRVDFWPKRPADSGAFIRATTLAVVACAATLGGAIAFKQHADGEAKKAQAELAAAKAILAKASSTPDGAAMLKGQIEAWKLLRDAQSPEKFARAAPTLDALARFNAPGARLDRFASSWVGPKAFIRAEGSAVSQQAAALAGREASKLGAVGSAGSYEEGWDRGRWTFSFADPLTSVLANAPDQGATKTPPPSKGSGSIAPDGVLARPSVPGSTYQPPQVFKSGPAPEGVKK